MSDHPPRDLLSQLNDQELGEARRWWGDLSDGARAEFLQLWDERNEDTALHGVMADDGTIAWHPLPIELRGALADPEDAADRKLAKQHLLEWVANHEDVQFFLIDRTFHICRAHCKAADVIRRGWLPSGYACPVDDASCPMERILDAAGGRSVRLHVQLRRRA